MILVRKIKEKMYYTIKVAGGGVLYSLHKKRPKFS